jgi:hypothetical protein
MRRGAWSKRRSRRAGSQEPARRVFTEYRVLSTPYSVPRTQYSALHHSSTPSLQHVPALHRRDVYPAVKLGRCRCTDCTDLPRLQRPFATPCAVACYKSANSGHFTAAAYRCNDIAPLHGRQHKPEASARPPARSSPLAPCGRGAGVRGVSALPKRNQRRLLLRGSPRTVGPTCS